MQELDVARQAALAGGQIVARYYRDGVPMCDKVADYTGSERKTYNLVSDADIESEQSIVEVVRKAFPNHEVLGEESHRGRTDAEHLWVIDPLDGTNNFAHRIPHFAVSIAYYERGLPKCGVVYNPICEDWYVAVREQGAWHNDQPARVGEQRQLDDVLVGAGFYYDRGSMMEATLAAIKDLFRKQIHGIRRFGTASLDLAMVGTGSLGAFFEYQLAPWDFAAGRIFVEEAGGKVSTCSGDSLLLATTSVLATNHHLHEKMVEIVREHWPVD